MNKKGFTLVELLAVIVILAIIALISTPIILGVIEKARIGAAEQSALGYIDAVEKQIITNEMSNTKIPKDSILNVQSLNNYINIKGKTPTNGIVEIDDTGIVVEAKIVISDYNILYKDFKAKVVEDDYKNLTGHDIENAYNSYKIGDKIKVKLGENKFGDFYVISNSDEKNNQVTAIYNQNVGDRIVWSSNDKNDDSGLKNLVNELENRTSSWTNVKSVRLLSKEDILRIFDKNELEGFSIPTKHWLLSGTYNFNNNLLGPDTMADDYPINYGYWTSAIKDNTNNLVWVIMSYYSSFGTTNAANGLYGLRPVITISKRYIQS